MIQFHYHRSHMDVPRLGIRRHDLLCHVFSDLGDVEASLHELQEWAHRILPVQVRIQHRGERRQHIDLWGHLLVVCGPPADRATLRRWLRPRSPVLVPA